ncbi:MAG: hypothetical protein K8T26_12625 [Lentisphaerae bacterium]|nr:hypothetical protein [Lentisphaerota bacterium]
MSQKRSLRNVRLTKDFHYRYLGLWVMITVALMLASNTVLFLWIHEHFLGVDNIVSDLHTTYIELKNWVLFGLLVESIAFAIGIVALAKLTAHRIAGPYIQLQKTFDAIRDGKLDARLHFREYDNLDHVAKSFADMMDALSKSKRDV